MDHRKVPGSAFVLAAALAVAAPSAPAAATQPICGDGVTEGLEQCDDGDTVSGDGCSYPSCLPEVCGDGIANPDPPAAEECDDGNTIDDDGCTFGTTPNCQLDCGDGEIDAATDPPELCDDGNATNGDGCDDDPSAESPGNCSHTDCGNGVLTPPETCDPPLEGFCDEQCQEIVIDVPPNPDQHRCIRAVNGNLAGVAKAESADAARCVREIARGKATTSCLGQDAKGQVARATAKTERTVARKCTGLALPDFAFTDAATVNAAGRDEVQDGLAAILGVPAQIATRTADARGATCQGEVTKQYAAVVGRWLLEANEAKWEALRGGRKGTPPPAIAPSELAAGIDAGVTGNASLIRAEAKAQRRIQQKCDGAQVAALFECGGATTLPQLAPCVIQEAERAACEALELADDLDLACP